MKVRVHRRIPLSSKWYVAEKNGAISFRIAKTGIAGFAEIKNDDGNYCAGPMAGWGREEGSDKWWVNKDGDWVVYYVQTEDEAIALATTLARMANE